MKICFFHQFEPPTATAQQRMFFKSGRTALQPQARRAQALWLAVMEQYRPEKPLQGAIDLRVAVTWTGKGDKVEARTKKPDLDNLAKLMLDAMTKAGFWRDDSQIAILVLEKFDGPIAGVAVDARELKTVKPSHICDCGAISHGIR